MGRYVQGEPRGPFGKLIQKIEHEEGWLRTHKEFAELAGVISNTVTKWYQGKSAPEPATMRALENREALKKWLPEIRKALHEYDAWKRDQKLEHARRGPRTPTIRGALDSMSSTSDLPPVCLAALDVIRDRPSSHVDDFIAMCERLSKIQWTEDVSRGLWSTIRLAPLRRRPGETGGDSVARPG